MRISDWSSDVCSSDLPAQRPGFFAEAVERASQLAEAAVRLPHPARQYVEIARDARRRRPLDDEAEHAPSLLGPRPALIHIDAEPADDDAQFLLGVGERALPVRSEERRAGQAGGSTCRSRTSTDL